MAKKVYKGFTLIELIVSMAIAGILISVGIPSFANMIQDGRQSATYNALVGELSYARSEAVKRSLTVSVCARSTDTECAVSSDWSDGWLLFVDNNGNGAADAGEDILRVNDELEQDQSLKSYSFTNTHFIRYRPRGNTDSVGHFVICDDRGNKEAKAINIVLTGAIRKAVDSDGNEIVEDMSGADVSCP